MLLCLFAGMSLFAILLSKSLILAFGYGTDCTFYDIGQFHEKNKQKTKTKKKKQKKKQKKKN